MLKFLTIGIPGLKASEWGTYFCLEKTDDIVLVSVHLIHNTCILKRESFSEAPVYMLLRFCLAFVSTASPRWISRNTSERWMGRPALLKWLGTMLCWIISKNRKFQIMWKEVIAVDEEHLTSTKILVFGECPFILRGP